MSQKTIPGIKMKPLVTLQRCLIWLCIHPAEQTASVKQKKAYVKFTAMLLIGHILYMTAILAFCLKFFAIDLERGLFALIVIVAVFISAYMLIIAICQMRQKTADVFKDLTAIYETYETEPSFRFLARANNLCEWIAQIYLKYAVGMCATGISTCLISAAYFICANHNLNANNFVHPAPILLPWDQSTLLGYTCEILFIAFCFCCYLIVTGTILVFFVSMCIHHRAFYKMFKHSVDKTKASKKNKCDKKFLCDLIRFHLLVKDLFLSSAEIFSPVVMVQLISSTIVMAIAVYNFDLQIQHVDFDVIFAIMVFSIGMGNAFLYCYFGAMANDSYAKMHDCIFELDWPELPIDLQRYFILMGANMQRPLHYHGFGVLYANLETFVRILRSVFSYYGIIKTITSK